MKKYSAMAFFALLLLSFSLWLKAVSQVEASDRVAPYLGEYREAVTALDKPLESAGERFWVFYAPLESKARITAAVSDFEGIVLTDKAKMAALASLVYKKELVDYLGKNKLSFADLAKFSESIDAANAALTRNLDALSSAYPNVDFLPLSRKVDDLAVSGGALSDAVTRGMELQSVFERDYTDMSLNDLFSYYNATFDKTSALIALAEEYKVLLYAKYAEVGARKDLSSEQKREIQSTLQKLDISELITSFKLNFDPIKASFLNYAVTSDAWVNNSVEGFFYRQAKVDAQKTYNLLRPKATALLAAEYDFLNYAINISSFNGVNVKAEWKGIENIMTSGVATSEDYALALQRMQSLDGVIDAINEKYAKYITATPRPKAPLAPDYSVYIAPAIGVIVLALAAYWLYNYYKRKAAEGAEEAGY